VTRDEALKLIQAFYKARDVDSPGLNVNNLGGAMVGDSQLYFEYVPTGNALRCSALIYRFRDRPRPGLLEAFQREASSGAADAGGGVVDFQPENKGLYLTRVYTVVMSDEAFAADLTRLMDACRVWRSEVFGRVTERVLHPKRK
jgi:hypothetical protein